VTFSANPTDFIVAAPASRVANFTYSPSQIFAGDTVTFTAEAEGQAGLTFNWDFGGGQTATGATATQAFAQSGDATVTLTVTDGQGGQAQKAQVVPVGCVPLLSA
jgi:PKD repeat protein